MEENRFETIIVTGGAGFIGANFVHKAMAETSARIVVFDKLTYAGNLRNLEALSRSPRLSFVKGDIASPSDVESLLGRLDSTAPTAIVNFAAESHVDRSIDGPRAFVRTNTVGVFELLEASRRRLAGAGAEERGRFRFLQVSTDEVYGSLGPTGLFSEVTPYAPNSPYSASKAGADFLVRAYHETYGLPTLITNCSNNYGPYQFPEKLIPLMILNALEGKDLPIYGDGGNVRDWLYVEDHCAAILLVLARGRPGEKYNIGGDCERRNTEIVDAICAILERLRPAASSAPLKARGAPAYASLKRFVQDRPGHDRRYAIDASKIRGEMGWTPAHDFQTGLERTVRWYLDHLSWCEDVQSGKYQRERLGIQREG